VRKPRRCLNCRATVTNGHTMEQCPFCLMPWDGSLPITSPIPVPIPPVRPRSHKRYKGTRKVALIGARDGWICHLCGEEVDRALPPLHPQAASCDHLLPRSQGGTDRQSNLKLAHRICNEERADRALTEIAL
jgi:hypothetical protein